MNELTIHLEPDLPAPLYEQIYNYIKTNIRENKIKSGEKLPSTRVLCTHLGVSRSTVELAYEQLVSEGYIESRPYRGYYVLEIQGLYQLEQSQKNIPAGQIKEEEKFLYDFTPNGVDLNSFPYNVWRKLSKECLMDDRAELFRLGHPQGEMGLREAICSYLYQARGVDCVPEQIIVGAGNDYLLMLLVMVLGTGHKVAVENPTYKQAYRLFRNLSCDVCTVDMDGQGMQIQPLINSEADIAFVMPSHQYPLGIVMPMQRRMELLKWAEEKEGRYIIEDDYDSEFRYKGKPIPALKSYDRSDKVIYIGTFSKSIAPAIRMSYLVLPASLMGQYRKRSYFLNSTVPKVDQLILQRFISEGYYERHLNKTRALYKGRHDTLITSLRPLQKYCSISGEHAGVHLLLQFKGNVTEKELIERAAKRKIKVYGLSEYYVDPKARREEKCTILLGYANMSSQQIKEAVQILIKEWMTE